VAVLVHEDRNPVTFWPFHDKGGLLGPSLIAFSRFISPVRQSLATAPAPGAVPRCPRRCAGRLAGPVGVLVMDQQVAVRGGVLDLAVGGVAPVVLGLGLLHVILLVVAGWVPVHEISVASVNDPGASAAPHVGQEGAEDLTEAFDQVLLLSQLPALVDDLDQLRWHIRREVHPYVDGVAEPATQRQPPPHQDRGVALAASAWAEASVVSQPFTPGAGECRADGALGIGSLVLRAALVGAERSQGLDGPEGSGG
jgi:hypothetical protein